MITVEADPRDLGRVLKKLQSLGGSAPGALRNAVNATAIGGRGLKELVNRAGNRAFQVRLSGGPMVFQRTGKARYPLRGVHGPSAAKMIEKVYAGGRGEAGLKEEIARLYRDNLQKQVDRVVSA